MLMRERPYGGWKWNLNMAARGGGGGSNEVNGSYGNGLWKILGVGHSFLVILDLK
jgi:hypothetical protein